MTITITNKESSLMPSQIAHFLTSRTRRAAAVAVMCITCSGVLAAPNAIADTNAPAKQQTQQTQQKQPYLVVSFQMIIITSP
jgi:hypothetical protein